MAAMLRCAYMLLEVPKAPGGRRRQTWLDGRCRMEDVGTGMGNQLEH